MRQYKTLIIILFLLGSLLRICLTSANPVNNAFDNHFEPTLLIMQTGEIPAKDACPQCYHPPVYYLLSAVAGGLSLKSGFSPESAMKLQQFINCVYSILTLFVIYLSLLRFRLSDFSRLMVFGILCFLPRHIYMAAINSNDSLSYLLASICFYLMLVTIDAKFNTKSIILLSACSLIALFVKYTTFIILPALFILCAFVYPFQKIPSRTAAAKLYVILLLVPALALSAYMYSNYKTYGSLLPDNYYLGNVAKQAHDEGSISVVDFKVLESIKFPLLSPGKLNSFWTLVYSGMWFDIDAKFLRFTDPDNSWWDHYFSWRRGDGVYPGSDPPIAKSTLLNASMVITLGLIPLILTVIGLASSLKSSIVGIIARATSDHFETTKTLLALTLLLGCVAIAILNTYKVPYYSAMKASYLLNAMPEALLFLAIGITQYENKKVFKLGMSALMCIFITSEIYDVFMIINSIGVFNMVHYV